MNKEEIKDEIASILDNYNIDITLIAVEEAIEELATFVVSIKEKEKL